MLQQWYKLLLTCFKINTSLYKYLEVFLNYIEHKNDNGNNFNTENDSNVKFLIYFTAPFVFLM